MAQISVTRALAQVKSLNDRIARATQTAFITVETGGKHNSGKPVQEVSATLQASLQSVQDLIAQRKALKSAIVKSNATATVSIGGVTYTVAEAIERKGSVILEKQLLNQLKGQLAQVIANVERSNIDVQKRLEALLTTTVGKDRKVDEAEIAAIRTPFLAQNEVKALDPNKLQAVVDKLQEEIDAFELEVDFALSEVNASTKIDV